jgi:hypothetical protein
VGSYGSYGPYVISLNSINRIVCVVEMFLLPNEETEFLNIFRRISCCMGDRNLSEVNVFFKQCQNECV